MSAALVVQSGFRTCINTPSKIWSKIWKRSVPRWASIKSACSATVTAACSPRLYALKYQQHLSHLVLASTFPSTSKMNEVLAREKAYLPPDKLARLEALEKAGLYGKGAAWEQGRYSEEYQKLAWGDGYFPFLFGARPDPTYDPTTANATTDWELYREMWGSDGEFVIDGNLRSVEYLDRLATIRVPTLIIAGDHDECDPALAREMQEKIGGSKLVILPNSGHMAFEDQPKLWIEKVRDFVNQ